VCGAVGRSASGAHSLFFMQNEASSPRVTASCSCGIRHIQNSFSSPPHGADHEWSLANRRQQLLDLERETRRRLSRDVDHPCAGLTLRRSSTRQASVTGIVTMRQTGGQADGLYPRGSEDQSVADAFTSEAKSSGLPCAGRGLVKFRSNRRLSTTVCMPRPDSVFVCSLLRARAPG
jgi:hypothetical protein